MAGLPPIESYPLPTDDRLPENVAGWTPHPDRAVLLVHDMQRYFLQALPDPLRGELLHNAAALRKRATALGVPVAYTAQPGRMTDEQRGLLKDFWGPGMRTDAADREVVAELTPAEGDWVLTKWRYSAFFRSDLLERMRAAGRDQLVLCGVYAHVGVLATALEAFTNDIQTFLAADALGDFSEAHHRLALDYAAQRCAVVLPSAEVFI
ncbi:isochorismatase family protein [Streptomyces lomondensis]|uniref:Phenazine biosynthesis protein PhzD n=2 Tax=Streptomyces lomondensis TaxID=68229 RepID=A0ABQ2X3J7_9ACTN|nr:isochorismatase family protein [Streptomyces lomondensis]MCF0079942.1 isochorismatase family protein [Streptomyces lomondensis]GGW97275.1 phenazine biosynthesis protein PhzD [Streptomyces lomondensis]